MYHARYTKYPEGFPNELYLPMSNFECNDNWIQYLGIPKYSTTQVSTLAVDRLINKDMVTSYCSDCYRLCFVGRTRGAVRADNDANTLMQSYRCVFPEPSEEDSKS